MLAETIDIRRWLRDDRRRPHAERVERDRAIGRTLEADDPVARVLGWWQRVNRDELVGRSTPTGEGPGRRVEAGRRVAGAGLALVGVLVGMSVAGVALTYEGRHPVNLFTLLGVLVGLPLLMLLFTLLLLPGRLPGLAPLQAVAAGMSPGRWVGAWLDRLLDAELFAPGLLGGRAAGAFSRWQLTVFSQWLGLGFFAGALAITLLLVTFSDLAFGWSTTLDMDPARVARWVSWLSAPWAGWFPAAAPDAELVIASQYFRLEEGGMALDRVARLGGWWPFVVMTMLVYGVLPRLVLLVVGLWRLRRATASLLLDDPEVTALRDRLDTPLVHSAADSQEAGLEPDRDSPPPPVEAVTGEGLVLVIWNAATGESEARRWMERVLRAGPEAAAAVGILQSDEERRRHVRELAAAATGGPRRVVLVTKGWEPPLLEFADFVTMLREELGSDCSITVAPLDVSGSRVRAADREVWAQALSRQRDPRLYVMEAES